MYLRVLALIKKQRDINIKAKSQRLVNAEAKSYWSAAKIGG